MDTIERYLEFRLFPKGIESLEHNGNYKLGHAYSHGC